MLESLDQNRAILHKQEKNLAPQQEKDTRKWVACTYALLKDETILIC